MAVVLPYHMLARDVEMLGNVLLYMHHCILEAYEFTLLNVCLYVYLTQQLLNAIRAHLNGIHHKSITLVIPTLQPLMLLSQ
jgi:hypothetical protein